MKKILYVLCLGLVFGGCDNNKEPNNVTEIIIKEENPNKEYIREEIIEEYEGGDRMVLATYKGEGSDQELIKRITYYSQNDGGGIMKEENYKNRKLDGVNIEYTKNGDPSYVKIYKEGDLTSEYDPRDELLENTPTDVVTYTPREGEGGETEYVEENKEKKKKKEKNDW